MIRNMIGIVGSTTDLHVDTVKKRIEELNHKVFLIDFKSFPYNWQASFELTGQTMKSNILDIDTGLFQSIWFRRRYAFEFTHEHDPDLIEFYKSEYRSFLTSLALIHLDKFWVSNPVHLMRATNKQVNLVAAQTCGFLIPDTYIGNNIYTLVNYVKPTSIYALKAAQSGFIKATVKNDVTESQSLFTQKVTGQYILDRIEQLVHCPVTIQEYVPKAFELRITVVGNKIFAARIDSQLSPSEKTRTDWRHYDLENTPHSEYELPDEIKLKCFALLKELGLQFGCIDMVVTPDNQYYYLEVNSTGQWLWIENLTGMPITQAIAQLLIDPESNKL